ncbi:LCP family glycopolymer transferase [Virgibacillus alimentarius]|uniref:LCP family glycopolymer transferase n=1 Tax=Virgibacillus alimentarius TaxID=698769 RepID=UPI0004937186|nr:LCP family protein [Virgibacillus alimentarius]
MKNSTRKVPKKNWLVIIFIIVFLFLLGSGVYASVVYYNAKNTINNKIYSPVEAINPNDSKNKIKAAGALNILLMGVKKEDGKESTDVMMILSLEPEKDTMRLISVPRSTRTQIADGNINDRVSNAYMYNGVEGSVSTMENFLEVDIDYYVSMNMTGFEEFIDELGGITVENDMEWNDGTYSFKEGLIDLDGDKASHFVRDREEDPNQNFGRTKRQRKVVQGVISRGARVGTVPKVNKLIHTLGRNMAANLDFDDIKKLLTKYKNTRKNIINYYIEGNETYIDGESYLIVPEDERQKVHDMLTNG